MMILLNFAFDYLQLSSSALRRHVMTVHTGEVHKTCHICKKGFASNINEISP